MPLYIREGSVLPLGPVKQYTTEKVDEPHTASIYPGKDAEFLLYEDDGTSFNYRKGEWMGVQMAWHDSRRTLTLQLADGSRMLPPKRRRFQVELGADTRPLAFEGKRVEISF
jgi:alpha-glucosidase (family GH31 glycosyl hydrolase)